MNVFIGDTIKISAPVGVSVSSFTIRKILFERPDGTTGSWIATIDPNDETAVSYTTLSTDLSISGLWRFQAFVDDGFTYLHGDVIEIQVFIPVGKEPSTTAVPTTHAPVTTLHVHTFPPPTHHPTTAVHLTTLHIHTFPPTTAPPE